MTPPKVTPPQEPAIPTPDPKDGLDSGPQVEQNGIGGSFYKPATYRTARKNIREDR